MQSLFYFLRDYYTVLGPLETDGAAAKMAPGICSGPCTGTRSSNHLRKAGSHHATESAANGPKSVVPPEF